MRAHIIFIGGTGACCAKAFLAAGAIGGASLVAEGSQVKVHTIDPDLDGSAQGAIGGLRAAYTKLQSALPAAYPCALETASRQHRPYDGFGQLPSQVTVPNLMGCTPQTPGHKVLQLLLDDHQISKDLRHGFYGWPGVGSAIWDRWAPGELPGIEDFAKAAQGEDVRIILVGSIFGGTGSSGIPTLAQRYRESIRSAQGRENIRLEALVLTPYFKVDPGNRPEGEDLIREQDNKFRTRHVMEDIAASQGGFDVVYLLGRKDTDQTEFPSDCYSLDAQKNPTTLIERLAAWAIWGTLLAPGVRPGSGTNHVFSIDEEGGHFGEWDPAVGGRFERAVARITAVITAQGIELGDWSCAPALSSSLATWLDLHFGGHSLGDEHLAMGQQNLLRKFLAILEAPNHALLPGDNWDALFRDLTGQDRYASFRRAADPGDFTARLQQWRNQPAEAGKALWNSLNYLDRIAHA